MAEDIPLGEVIIPLAEEAIAVTKREIETGQVRVALSTDVEQVVARETLRGRRVEIELVTIDRTLVLRRIQKMQGGQQTTVVVGDFHPGLHLRSASLH
jgi:stress response protein YsnF